MPWKSDGPDGHYLLKLLKYGQITTSMTAKDGITMHPTFSKYNYGLFRTTLNKNYCKQIVNNDPTVFDELPSTTTNDDTPGKLHRVFV